MSLPRYAEYKNSGVEWLGEVPAHWAARRVKEFTEFCGGGTPSRDNLSFWNGNIPWVSPKDMKFERLKGAEECITNQGLANSSSSLVDPGRLLMVVRSGILKHTIPVAINDVPVALNQDMKALRFSEQLAISEFFLRWVQGLNDVLLLAWSKQGATVESIEHTYLAETLVPLPPLPEQVKITAFLDRETGKIDALIAEQEKLIALLAEKRQATISHAVTRGLNPNAPMKDSGVAWLGEVPAHWIVVPLRWYSQCNSGDGITSSDIEPISDLEHEVPAIGGNGRMGFTSSDNVREPVLAIGRVGALCGNVHLVNPPAWISDNALILTPSHAFLLTFLAYALRSRNLNEIASKTAQPLITGTQVADQRVPLPPKEEQELIAAFISKETGRLDALNTQADHAITLLKERRSALIAAAVTGQIDVRELGSC